LRGRAAAKEQHQTKYYDGGKIDRLRARKWWGRRGVGKDTVGGCRNAEPQEFKIGRESREGVTLKKEEQHTRGWSEKQE